MTGKETIELTVASRKLGKGASRSNRNQKLIPAIIYGPKLENQPVLLEELAVHRYGRPKFESTIFSLKSEEKGLNSLRVLIKDVQKDPVTHKPVHVDLFAPDMEITSIFPLSRASCDRGMVSVTKTFSIRDSEILWIAGPEKTAWVATARTFFAP